MVDESVWKNWEKTGKNDLYVSIVSRRHARDENMFFILLIPTNRASNHMKMQTPHSMLQHYVRTRLPADRGRGKSSKPWTRRIQELEGPGARIALEMRARGVQARPSGLGCLGDDAAPRRPDWPDRRRAMLARH